MDVKTRIQKLERKIRSQRPEHIHVFIGPLDEQGSVLYNGRMISRAEADAISATCARTIDVQPEEDSAEEGASDATH
jgi:hypothetical protein